MRYDSADRIDLPYHQCLALLVQNNLNPLALFGKLQYSRELAKAVFPQTPEIVLELPNVCVLPAVAFLDFVHIAVRRDTVKFDAFEHEFLFAGVAAVVFFVGQPAERHKIRPLLHLDVVGEEPELCVAHVVVIHLRSGNVTADTHSVRVICCKALCFYRVGHARQTCDALQKSSHVLVKNTNLIP